MNLVLPITRDIHNYGARLASLIRSNKFRLCKPDKNSLNLKLYNVLPPPVKNLNNKKFKIVIKKFLSEHALYSMDEYFETVKSTNSISTLM